MDFSKLDHRILRYIDERTFARFLNFKQYFSFQKFFGFPLKKLDFFYTHGYRLNLKNPVTLNEKIVYRQLFERDPLLSTIADKYVVREYVKEKIGEKYLIPLLQVADSFNELDFSNLPDNYIMKMNHASGRVVIFNNGKLLFKQRADNRDYDKEELKKIIDAWFVEKYRYQQLIWFVQPIKRRMLIEKTLVDDNGKMPKDYKFYVFGGKVEFISVIRGMYSNYTENLYDRNWEPVDFTFADPDPVDIDQEIPLFDFLWS